MNRIVVCENIRSAYNVGNIIRSAECLGWDVVISGYSPHPDEKPKVAKTSLWAHENIDILDFRNTSKSLKYLRANSYTIVSAELTEDSKPLDKVYTDLRDKPKLAVILWNEKKGVLPETLSLSDEIVHIPMLWKKDSLNVWQASGIFMWAL